ncbi:odorant receptor 85f-like [Arctopsyche grandis]|uniref:odorant receptor 85f-like n=1 Tax=Arctopsyche grandis TaxID=121162 RepID=UPI00406D96CE
MLQKFKDIFNKRSFNIDQKYIRAYDFHSILKFNLISNGVFFNNKESKFRLLSPIFNISLLALDLYFMFTNAFHCVVIKDVSEMSESLTYGTIVKLMFLQEIMLLIKSKSVRHVIDIIEIDFIEMDQATDGESMRNKTMDVFGVALFAQMLLSSIVLCMTGFQIAVVIENGQIKILFVMLFGGAVVQLLIPSIIGSMYTEKAKLVGDACYSCNWERFDIHNTIERDLQIFLIRSSRPLEISALGLTIISMETFSAIMSTAASYFTMIRQMNESV